MREYQIRELCSVHNRDFKMIRVPKQPQFLSPVRSVIG